MERPATCVVPSRVTRPTDSRLKPQVEKQTMGKHITIGAFAMRPHSMLAGIAECLRMMETLGFSGTKGSIGSPCVSLFEWKGATSVARPHRRGHA